MQSVLYDNFALCNIHDMKNSYSERNIKFKVSQKKVKKDIHNMCFIICLSLYTFHSTHFTVCTSNYALHTTHFTLCTLEYEH